MIGDGLYYEEFCGSIYLRKRDSKDIVRMVDGTDKIAFVFERENFNILRMGSPDTVSDYMRKFEGCFPGFVASLTLPKGLPLEDLNSALKTQNLHALITKYSPESIPFVTSKDPGEGT